MEPSRSIRNPDAPTNRHRSVLVVVLLSALLLSVVPPVLASAQSATGPVTREQCFGGGWRSFPRLGFRNQGQCVSYVATQSRRFETIKLLATNDFHGRLLPPDSERGGAAYLAAHLDAIRDSHRNTLYVDAGDLVGATPVLSNLFYDEPSIEAMNLMGLDIQTVGNHEFDRGQDELLRRAEGGCFDDDCSYRDGLDFKGSDFATLSTNVIVAATGEALTQPYDIINVAGIDVGFVGVTTVTTPGVVHPDGIVGLTFLPEADAINATVPELQAAGADIIVVLMHEGGYHDGDANSCVNFRGPAADIAAQLHDAVDVVVTGHTHQTYVCDLPDGPLVTQAMDYGRMFTEIELRFDRQAGEIVTRSARNHTVTHDVTPHPDVLELIAFYDELSLPLREEIVGHSEVFLSGLRDDVRSREMPLGNLATDALIHQYGDLFSVDFAFQNGGGLRANMTTLPRDETTELYPIRREDVLAVWPFGNIVTIAEVDGPTLEAILANGVKQIGGGRFIHVAGLRIDYEIVGTFGGLPSGELVNVQYWKHHTQDDGTAVDLSPSASYVVAMNDFIAAGGDFYPILTDVTMTDAIELAVERYLMAESPVSPQVEGRIVDVTND